MTPHVIYMSPPTFHLRYGWRRKVPNTLGNYLEDKSPAMVDSRKAFQLQRKMHGIIPHMVCNFDQLYKPLFRALKSVWHRDDDSIPGNCENGYDFLRSLKGKRTEVALMLAGLQESFEKEAKVRRLTSRDPRLDMPDDWRAAITLVTFLWGNGEIGPLTFNVPDGYMALMDVVEFNKKWEGQASLSFSFSLSLFLSYHTA